MIRALLLLAISTTLIGCGTCGYPDGKIGKILPGMTTDQVTALLGAPAKIDQAESVDQTIQGEVYHYPCGKGEDRVVFVNHAVFKAEFVPGAQS